MTCRQRTLLATSVLTAFGMQAGSPAIGQTAQPDVRRVRGIIAENQTWSGRVIITDDLSIEGATVTIAAGTIVEFACKRSGHHPTLVVGPPTKPVGHLNPMGTAEKPVTFRTLSGTNPGRMIVHVRGRLVPTSRSDPDAANLPPSERAPGDATWQHVRFENLGHVKTRQQQGRKTRLAEPAVLFNVIGAAHTLGVVNCSFVECARLLVRSGDGSRITIVSNRFDGSTDRVAVEVRGHEGLTPVGPVAISRNKLSAALALRAAPAMIIGNILIGEDASIVIEEDKSDQTRVAENYVHNTTASDDGRYCLQCENASAVIENNIFRGGTTCVRTGSRRMAGNVLIAAPRLESEFVKASRTHQLVAALPSGSTFERNILLGPAYSLLVPHPAATSREPDGGGRPTIIRHNLFDGLDRTNRAIHLNPIGARKAGVEVWNNIFLRIPSLIYDEGRTTETLRYADHNAIAPEAPRAFDQVKIRNLQPGDNGWSAHDVKATALTGLALTGEPLPRIPDWDADILAGKTTPTQIRNRLLATYRPLPHSPLVAAGRSMHKQGGTNNPTIGPSEPAGQ